VSATYSNKRYQTLQADAAINDSANHRDGQGNAVGSATALIFRVFGDGKELWHSKPLQRGGESEACSVDVSTVENWSWLSTVPDRGGARRASGWSRGWLESSYLV